MVHSHIRYPCQFCEHVARRKSNLAEHIDSKHSEANMFCSKCDYKTSCKKKLKYHLQTKHNVFDNATNNSNESSEENIFACQYCMAMFTWTGLMQHIKVVHKTLTDPTVIETLLET